ncbi:uncharacterized protein [Arachis hypogaea]|uniref:uncharacterized protein n=1 Tax=Arachis hypogaea TaxID=3818 RepID=UPI003B218362
MVVKKNGKPQAAKILRYFPLIPRLQRLYMSSKTAVDMLWHKRGPNSDGMYRNPRDAEAWKSLDRRYFDFFGDPRSVHLALASDGFNPFGNMSLKYSIWRMAWATYLGGIRTMGGPVLREIWMLMLTGSHTVRNGVSWVQSVAGKRIRRQQTAIQDESPWNKRSIFFELPYWENNGLRHNLDVMHIEKNVCDNVVFTILNEKAQVVKFEKPRLSHSNEISTANCVKECIAYPSVFCPGRFIILFYRVCSKSIDPQQLPLLQDHVVHILCCMEMIFLPSFFTIMVHLTLHLVEEVRLGGPVHYRWMYPIERLQPEGSIAEGYLSEEILVFCSRYLDNVESRINRPMRVDDRPRELMPDESATMFLEVPLGSIMHPNELQWLACGPNVLVSRFTSYNINEFKFRTLSREEGLKTQNSGIYVTSDIRSYASKRNSNVAVHSVLYYGKLADIIELNYSSQFTVVLFRCTWANTTSGRGIKQDSLGHTVVNFSHPIHTGDREDDEPYILASEARFVYYVDDEADKEWCVVVHVNPRDLFDMGEDIGQCQFELSPQPILAGLSEFDVKGVSLRRDDDLEEPTTDAIDNCEEATNL